MNLTKRANFVVFSESLVIGRINSLVVGLPMAHLRSFDFATSSCFVYINLKFTFVSFIFRCFGSRRVIVRSTIK